MSGNTEILELGRIAWRVFLALLAVIALAGAGTMIGVSIWWLTIIARAG